MKKYAFYVEQVLLLVCTLKQKRQKLCNDMLKPFFNKILNRFLRQKIKYFVLVFLKPIQWKHFFEEHWNRQRKQIEIKKQTFSNSKKLVSKIVHFSY